jgi:hypothetical protein
MPGGRRSAPTVGARPAAAPPPATKARAPRIDLSRLVRAIDWTLAPQPLREGDLSSLRPDVQAVIRAAAAEPPVVTLAARLGLAPVVLILALLARTSNERSAARLAKSVLGDRPPSEVKTLAAHFALGRGSWLGWLRQGSAPEERPPGRA